MEAPPTEQSLLVADVRPEADLVQEQLFAQVHAALFGPTPATLVRLGPYTVIERVGSGGLGTVFLAWDGRLQRRVALKVLHRSHARARADSVLHEARALARLADPHVVAVFDTGRSDDGEAWIAMEFVAGTDLRKAARRRTPTAVELARWLVQAADGLAAAHRAGIVHGDIKPENLLLGDDGRVRVVDFGMAVAIHGSDRAARGGTAGFLAPEIRAGASASERADVYALCVAAEQLRLDAGLERWPRRVTRVLARGREPDPGTRASLADVREALAHVARAPRDRVLLALGGALAVGVFVTLVGSEPGGGLCKDLPPDPGWSSEAPARVRAQLDGWGEQGTRVWHALAPRLERAASSWHALRDRACLADEPRARAQLRGCLERRNLQLAALLEALDAATPASGVRGEGIAESIDDSEACQDDVRALDADVAALRERILLGDMLRQLGDGSRAVEVADEGFAEARRLGDAALLAPSALALGRALYMTSAMRPARERLEQAYFAAVTAGDDVGATEAAVMLMRVHASGMGELDEAMRWRDALLGQLRRAGNPVRLRVNALDAIARAADNFGDRETVAAVAHELLRIDDPELDDNPSLQLTVYYLLATWLRHRGDAAGEVAQNLAALSVATRGLPEGHVEIGQAWAGVGSAWADLGETDRAIAALRKATVLLERGGAQRAIGHVEYQLARLALEQSRFDEAQAHADRCALAFRRTLGPRHPDHVLPMTATAEIALARGDYAAARAAFEAALIVAVALPDRAYLLFGRGEASRLAGAGAQARIDYQRGRDAIPDPSDNPVVLAELWVGEARSWAAEGEADEARHAFAQARAVLAGVVTGPEFEEVITRELAALDAGAPAQ
ncbi:MAG: protein kinase [Nannocystaceae bacterium]|nr:protein kinase [Nannocystaceae bacterium]